MSKYTFMTSLMTFYLKGSASIDSNQTSFKAPNTILKFIPLGAKNHNIPVNQISGVNTSFSLDIKAFLAGVVLAFIGLGAFGDSFFAGLILLAIGAGMVISSFTTLLQVEKTSGNAVTISFLIFDKNVAEQIADEINNTINNRINDTNVRVHTAESTDKIVAAINNK